MTGQSGLTLQMQSDIEVTAVPNGYVITSAIVHLVPIWNGVAAPKGERCIVLPVNEYFPGVFASPTLAGAAVGAATNNSPYNVTVV